MNIFCAYCKEPLTQRGETITVCSDDRMYLFCSIGCRDLCGFGKVKNRFCAREVCNNKVAEGNRMLCSSCYKYGNHLGEPDISFTETEIEHWGRMERELQRRIKERIHLYSSKDMSQEELRSLVPSLQEEAA